MDIINNRKELVECVLFVFPLNSEQIEVLNYCTLYTKCYIYVEKLKGNNKLDLYACQVQIKHAPEIEFNICKNITTLEKFEKFQLLYENL